MGLKSIAAIQHAARKIEIAELPVPDRLGPDEALMRVEGSGICGSDYEQYAGHLDGTGLTHYPLILGHEPVGRIEWLGEDVARRWGVKVGDRVAVEAHVGCGVCRQCTSGHIVLCPTKLMYGYMPLSVGSGLWGSYSDYMVLKGNTILHKLPDSISIEDAVLFNPLGAGFEWVINTCGTQPGDDVLILGPGQRGLAAVIAAVVAGANRIAVTGLAKDREKLDIALSVGATEAIVVDPSDPTSMAKAADAGLFDRIVDVTPYAMQPIHDAIALARPGATITLGGLKGMRELPGFVSDKLILKSLTLKGALGVASRSYALAVRAVASGAFDFARWHTHTMRVSEVETAIQMLAGEVSRGPEPIHMTIVPNG